MDEIYFYPSSYTLQPYENCISICMRFCQVANVERGRCGFLCLICGFLEIKKKKNYTLLNLGFKKKKMYDVLRFKENGCPLSKDTGDSFSSPLLVGGCFPG